MLHAQVGFSRALTCLWCLLRAGTCGQAIDAVCAGIAHPGSDGTGAGAHCSLLLGLVRGNGISLATEVRSKSRIRDSPGVALAYHGWRHVSSLAGELGHQFARYILHESTHAAIVGPLRRVTLAVGRSDWRVS